jgi:hypothetical protein
LEVQGKSFYETDVPQASNLEPNATEGVMPQTLSETLLQPQTTEGELPKAQRSSNLMRRRLIMEGCRWAAFNRASRS